MPSLTHEIRYRYTCENCGKQTKWFNKEFSSNYNDFTAVTEVASKLLAYDNLRAILNGFQTQTLIKRNYTGLDGGKSCPFCGKHQSWLPLHDVTTISPVARVLFYSFGYMLLVLIAFLIFAFAVDTDVFDNYAWIWSFAFGGFILFGAILAVRRNKKNAAGNKAQQETVTTRNVPEIDWNNFGEEISEAGKEKLSKFSEISDPKERWTCKKCGQPNEKSNTVCIGCGEYK